MKLVRDQTQAEIRFQTSDIVHAKLTNTRDDVWRQINTPRSYRARDRIQIQLTRAIR